MTSRTGKPSVPASPSLEKWGIVWGAVTYSLLAISLGVSLADGTLAWPLKATVAGLSIFWGAWYWAFVVRSRRWIGRVPVLFASFVVSIAASATLARIHPVFTMLLFGYYGITFGVLPVRWAIPSIVLASLALAVRFVDPGIGIFTTRNLLYVLGCLATGFLDILLGLFIASILHQYRERSRMIDELEAARGELVRAEREAGALEERHRLAGEIHDTMAQGFTSIILHLESAELAFDADLSKARMHVERALKASRENLDEARRVLWALKPDILEREPLGAAIERTVRKWGDAAGVRTEAAVTGSARPLPSEAETALLRTVQEALANVRKHARASRVSVTLSFMEDEVIVDVQDDGRGFAAARVPSTRDWPRSGGYGLPAMRRRVENLGGSLTVESAPGEGTTLMVSLPLLSEPKGSP
jgi:signal transduction histidine kinase